MWLVRLQWHQPLFYLACNEISAQQQFCALWGATAEDFPPLTRRGEKENLGPFEMVPCSLIAMAWLKKLYGVEATSLRHCCLRSPWGARRSLPEVMASSHGPMLHAVGSCLARW
ncbi:hypothetical protein E2320_001804 [Naja naja]|nr:hypothetical protein E2320_001804 [Naja naja]